jgi:Tfp pilus assembly protein PilO
MAAIQNRRVWLGGGVLIAILLLAVSWLMFISPKLSDASGLRTSAASAQTQDLVLQAKVARLKKQNDHIAELTAGLRAAVAQLPYDSGLPDFTRQVSQQAADNHAAITALNVGAIAPVTSGAHGVFSIQITLISQGAYRDQLAFLKVIQVAGPRRTLVNSALFAPGAKASDGSLDASSTMTMQLTIFSAPQSAAIEALLDKQIAAASGTSS